jgi:hypothetical protein
MPRYRATRPLYIRKLIVPGEEFESDLPPGRAWEPLDDDARAAAEKHRASQGKVIDIVERLDPKPRDVSAVDIPADWRELHATSRRNLAQKLGAQSNVKTADADTYIEAELARRANQKGQHHASLAP